jgi:SM-20-related protein
MNWLEYWQKYLDQHADVLDTLVEDGFAVIDQALPDDLFVQLVQQSHHEADYQAAKITAGGRLEAVRSDSTRWIDEQDQIGSQYLSALYGLGNVLNQALYLGIRSVEAHYAHYQVGQFYVQHVDNPKGSDIRAISTVLYLWHDLDDVQAGMINLQKNWQDDWGGQLRLHDLRQMSHDILPMMNRMVIFQSDLPHEVLPATQVRRSIAGWLRRDKHVYIERIKND